MTEFLNYKAILNKFNVTENDTTKHQKM